MVCFLFLQTLILLLKDVIGGNHPIILLHGIGGTQMESRLINKKTRHFYCYHNKRWTVEWLKLMDDILLTDCLIEDFSLYYNPTNDSMDNLEGVHIRPRGPHGSLTGIKYLDPNLPHATAYFHAIIHMLEKNFHYKEMVDLYSYSYDFRNIGDMRKMAAYFTSLSLFIEGLKTSGNKSVIFITHSMGCLLISHFLSTKLNRWKDIYVNAWYSIAGPFGGSVKAPITALIGFPIGFASHYISLSKFKFMLATYPSLYFLFPSPQIFNKSQIIAVTKNIVYNVENSRLLIASSQSNISTILKYIPDAFVQKPPGVDMVCAYGEGLQTMIKLTMSHKLFGKRYNIDQGDGDATVNIESLRACSKWIPNNNHSLEIFEVHKAEHTEILKNHQLLQHLEAFISQRNSQN